MPFTIKSTNKDAAKTSNAYTHTHIDEKKVKKSWEIKKKTMPQEKHKHLV